MTTYTIYGDSISGNCLKVKWTADLLGLHYDWIETSVLEKETRTEQFLELNAAGQVPIIILPDGEVLAQSNAIVLYLLRTHSSPLLPQDDLEYGKMLQWMFWEQYTHEPAIAVRRFHKHYLQKPDEEIDPALLQKGNAALSVMEKYLAGDQFFAGSDFSAADIALVAYTRLAGQGGFQLSDFPAVQSWISQVEASLDLSPVEGEG